MRVSILRAMTLAAFAVAVSSCNSRVETRLSFPPAADVKVEAEPVFPAAALEPGPLAAEAERKWNDDMIIWGRKGWQQVRRVCEYHVRLGLKVPPGWCRG